MSYDKKFNITGYDIMIYHNPTSMLLPIFTTPTPRIISIEGFNDVESTSDEFNVNIFLYNLI